MFIRLSQLLCRSKCMNFIDSQEICTLYLWIAVMSSGDVRNSHINRLTGSS